MKITNAVLNQKLDDLKEMTVEIRTHVERTNGRVRQSELRIESMCTRQDEMERQNSIRRGWIMWVPSMIAVIIALFALFQ